MKRLLFVLLLAALISTGCRREVNIFVNHPSTSQTPDDDSDDNPGNSDEPSDEPEDDPQDTPETNTDNIIYYTSSDGRIVEPYSGDLAVEYPFGEGVEIVSNTYEDGKGIMIFNAPVATIGYYAFANCTTLTSITIPGSVVELGMDVFSGTYSLAAYYGKFASDDNLCLIVDGVLYNFAKGCGLTEYIVPEGVTSIGRFSFAGCESLTDVTIPYGVTIIEDGAFSGCENLENIVLPEGVTTIENGAFHNCYALKNINFPNSLTTIESSTFGSCQYITSLDFPENVATIGDFAFSRCYNIEPIYCRAVVPPALGVDVFKYPHADETTNNNPIHKIYDGLKHIYVPRESVEAYKAAENWSDYAHLIEPYDF